MQHGVRQGHAASLDICHGRLAAKGEGYMLWSVLAETPVSRQSRSLLMGSVGLAAYRSMARQTSTRRPSARDGTIVPPHCW